MRNINGIFPFNEKHLRTFITVYNEFYPPIKYFAWQLLNDKRTAETVTLNAFVKLWNSSVLRKDSQQIANYLFRITGIACDHELKNEQLQPIWFKPLRRHPQNQYALLAREATTFNELAKVFQDPGSRETYKNISSLFVKHLTGIATVAENLQLEEWISLSVENRKWFDRFNNFDFINSRIERMEEIFKEANPNDCLQLLHNNRQAERRCMRRTARYAAAAVVLVLFANPWFNNPVFQHYPLATNQEQQEPGTQFAHRDSPEAWSFEGPRQNKHRIINRDRSILINDRLADGSVITLNAGSELVYPDEFDTKRKVTLKGEAYFTVVKDTSLPFLVAANGVHTEACGGEFNVRSYLDEDQTTITALTGASLRVAAGPYELILPAGQTALIKKGFPIEVYKTVNAEKIVAYKNQRFYFEHDNINQVAVEIARWYGLTVVGVDSAHTPVSFAGSRLMKVEDVIKKLVISGGQPHVTIEGNKLIIH